MLPPLVLTFLTLVVTGTDTGTDTGKIGSKGDFCKKKLGDDDDVDDDDDGLGGYWKGWCRVQPISPFYSRLTSYEQPASHIIVITLVEMIKTMEMIKGWQR